MRGKYSTCQKWSIVEVWKKFFWAIEIDSDKNQFLLSYTQFYVTPNFFLVTPRGFWWTPKIELLLTSDAYWWFPKIEFLVTPDGYWWPPNFEKIKNHVPLQNPSNLTVFKFWKWNIVSTWGVDFLIIWIAQSDVWFFGLAGCLRTLENKAFGNFEKNMGQIHGSWLSSTYAKPLPPMANFFDILGGWGQGHNCFILTIIASNGQLQ